MKTKQSLILALALGFSCAAHAAVDRAGNGGNGVRLDGKTYLLDLVEAGVESNPYFNPAVAADAATKSRLMTAIPFLADDTQTTDLLARKLKEVSQLDPLTAWMLLKGIEMYTWDLVNPALLTVGDEEMTLDIPANLIVQLAVRSNRRIQINRTEWSPLESTQKAALLLHEIIYAEVFPIEDKDPITGVTSMKQSSPIAREIVGYLFKPDASTKGRGGFLAVAGGQIPTHDSGVFLKSANNTFELTAQLAPHQDEAARFRVSKIQYYLKFRNEERDGKNEGLFDQDSVDMLCNGMGVATAQVFATIYKASIDFNQFSDHYGITRQYLQSSYSDHESDSAGMRINTYPNKKTCRSKIAPDAFKALTAKLTKEGFTYTP